jgi:hypothetical protein
MNLFRLCLQPYRLGPRLGQTSAGRRKGVRRVLLDLSRSNHARPLRTDDEGDLPGRPFGEFHPVGRWEVDLVDVLSLSVGPQLFESEGVQRDG